MKKITFSFCFSLLLLVVSAQKTDKKLLSKLTEAIQGFNGDVGIYVKEFKQEK